MLSLSQHIRAWRLKRGLTQAQLALRAGIPRPNLIDLELGRRDCTVSTLERLATALDLSPGTLLDRLPHREPVLDRHDIDRLARHLVYNETLTARLRAYRDALFPLLYPLLRAIDSPLLRSTRLKTRRVRRASAHAAAFPGLQLTEQITQRVNKLAAVAP